MFCGYDNNEVTLYLNRDNAVTIIPYSDYLERVNYDMTAVTRVTADADLVTSTVSGDAIQGDSDDSPTVVWWEEVDTGELDENGDPVMQWRIYCKVGLFTGMVPGEYHLPITIYDPDHPNGLLLPGTESDLTITVVDIP